jgi:hypothetical protein
MWFYLLLVTLTGSVLNRKFPASTPNGKIARGAVLTGLGGATVLAGSLLPPPAKPKA